MKLLSGGGVSVDQHKAPHMGNALQLGSVCCVCDRVCLMYVIDTFLSHHVCHTVCLMYVRECVLFMSYIDYEEDMSVARVCDTVSFRVCHVCHTYITKKT